MKEYKSYSKEFFIGVKESDKSFKKCKLRSSKDLSEYARQFYYDDIEVYESFFVIFLNNSNNTIGWVKISQGGLRSTIVDIKIVCKYAIDSLATSIALIHNHPSGNLMPSNDDREITDKIKTALKMFDTQVIDHIILTKDSYYSFVDEGIL